METFEVLRIKDKERERIKDRVAREVPLTIELNGKELVTLLCTPADLEDLIRGFLYTSGFIKQNKEIKKILIDEERGTARVKTSNKSLDKGLIFKRLYTSGCGQGTIFYRDIDLIHRRKLNSRFRISSHSLTKLMRQFREKSAQFIKTGGVHSAALTSGERILVFREDIGRHNACDKVIGRALATDLDLGNTALLTSGRISSEILLKTRKGKIPLVASRSAPTDQAVKLARAMQITLVGFARGKRMNIYSSEGRIS